MKQAIFAMLDEYADWEGAYLSSTLNQASGWEVKTASIKQDVVSIGGFKTTVDYRLEQIPANCELLILIGGNSWQIKNSEQIDKDIYLYEFGFYQYCKKYGNSFA